MPEPPVLVVGAGVSGLAFAARLAPVEPVIVVDRLPAAGGVLGYQHPAVRELEARAQAAGVRWRLATTAVRWRDRRALLVGPAGIQWQPARALVYAGGTRPCTAAEAGVFGPRLGGVLPATVALHLLEAGVLLGRHVVVAGEGHWARAVLAHLGEQPCEAIAAGDDPPPAARRLPGWRVEAVDGRARVSSVTLERLGTRMRVPCDALVLASHGRPLRNVDGAILPGSPGVTFVQPDGIRGSVEDAIAAGSAAAAALPAEPAPSPDPLEVS